MERDGSPQVRNGKKKSRVLLEGAVTVIRQTPNQGERAPRFLGPHHSPPHATRVLPLICLTRPCHMPQPDEYDAARPRQEATNVTTRSVQELQLFVAHSLAQRKAGQSLGSAMAPSSGPWRCNSPYHYLQPCHRTSRHSGSLKKKILFWPTCAVVGVHAHCWGVGVQANSRLGFCTAEQASTVAHDWTTTHVSFLEIRNAKQWFLDMVEACQ
ncbi:hypothetical protein ACJQWK_00880 [Exserohilum turcicum]